MSTARGPLRYAEEGSDDDAVGSSGEEEPGGNSSGKVVEEEGRSRKRREAGDTFGDWAEQRATLCAEQEAQAEWEWLGREELTAVRPSLSEVGALTGTKPAKKRPRKSFKEVTKAKKTLSLEALLAMPLDILSEVRRISPSRPDSTRTQSLDTDLQLSRCSRPAQPRANLPPLPIPPPLALRSAPLDLGARQCWPACDQGARVFPLWAAPFCSAFPDSKARQLALTRGVGSTKSCESTLRRRKTHQHCAHRFLGAHTLDQDSVPAGRGRGFVSFSFSSARGKERGSTGLDTHRDDKIFCAQSWGCPFSASCSALCSYPNFSALRNQQYAGTAEPKDENRSTVQRCAFWTESTRGPSLLSCLSLSLQFESEQHL